MIQEMMDFVSMEAKSDSSMVAGMIVTVLGSKWNITVRYGLEYSTKLYHFVCGPSSRTRKSTSFGMVRKICDLDTFKIGTVQALMKKLKKSPIAFSYHDEASGLLKQMASDIRGEKGLGEMLNELITSAVNDTVSESETLASLERGTTRDPNIIVEGEQHQPVMSIRSPRLSMELLTTPKSLSYITSDELVGGGFFYRCLLCVPKPALLSEDDELSWNSGTAARIRRITEFADRFSQIPDVAWYITVPDDIMRQILRGLTIEGEEDELEAYRTHLKTMAVKCAAIKCVDRMIELHTTPRPGESFIISVADVDWTLTNVIRPAMYAFINMFKDITVNPYYTKIVQYIKMSTDTLIKVRGDGKNLKKALGLDSKLMNDFLADAIERAEARFITIPNTNNVPVEYICKDDDCEGCERVGACQIRS